MTAVTSALVFQVKEGATEDAARQEVGKIRESAEGFGAQVNTYWLQSGTAPPGSLVIQMRFPDGQSYAEAMSGEAANAFRIAQARGQSALNVTQNAVLVDVVNPDA